MGIFVVVHTESIPDGLFIGDYKQTCNYLKLQFNETYEIMMSEDSTTTYKEVISDFIENYKIYELNIKNLGKEIERMKHIKDKLVESMFLNYTPVQTLMASKLRTRKSLIRGKGIDELPVDVLRKLNKMLQ